MAEFSNKYSHSKAIKENVNTQVFVPLGGARYKPVETKTCIEGTFMHKKKQKKADVTKNMHVGHRKQLQEAKAIIAQEDVPIDCSPPCTQELPEEDFPEIVLLASLGVGKCHGCKGQIIRKNCQFLKGYIFCMQVLQIWIHKVQSGNHITETFILT